MHLFSLIIGLMLVPSAYGKVCFQCSDPGTGNCTETQCGGQACAAVVQRTYQSTGGSYTDARTKFCMDAEKCLTGSINVGFELAVACCKSNLCNNKFPSIPLNRSPNGLTCYTCQGNDDCSHALQCSGKEDRCMSGKAQVGGYNMTLKGCASRSLCMSLANMPGVIDAETTCCEGEFCNGPPPPRVKSTDLPRGKSTHTSSATSTAVSFLFLVAPVVSVILFN